MLAGSYLWRPCRVTLSIKKNSGSQKGKEYNKFSIRLLCLMTDWKFVKLTRFVSVKKTLLDDKPCHQEGLPTSDFWLPTSDFRLPTSNLRFPTSKFECVYICVLLSLLRSRYWAAHGTFYPLTFFVFMYFDYCLPTHRDAKPSVKVWPTTPPEKITMTRVLLGIVYFTLGLSPFKPLSYYIHSI